MPVHYTGTDTLELLTEAHNYNTDLVRRVLAVTRDGGVAQNGIARPIGECLDFGAGLGTFALPLRKAGRSVTCVETDLELQKKLQLEGFAVHESLAELPAHHFGCIYTLNVFEHIKDDQAILSQFPRLLTPGGRVYIYVPAFMLLFSSLDKKVGHHRRYRLAQLVKPLRQHGFVITRARYVDTVGFFSSLFYRLMHVPNGKINRRTLYFFDRFLFPLNRVLDPLCGRWFGKNIEVIATHA
jgi:SAM-dependent methyltransferase